MGETSPGWRDSTIVSVSDNLGAFGFGWNLSFVHEVICHTRCQWEVLAGSQRPRGISHDGMEIQPCVDLRAGRI